MNRAFVNSNFFRETEDPEAAARLDRSDVMSRWILVQDGRTQRQAQASAGRAATHGLREWLVQENHLPEQVEASPGNRPWMRCAAVPLQASCLPARPLICRYINPVSSCRSKTRSSNGLPS